MRYVVIGTSGSGKSQFAQCLAKSNGSKYIELDNIHWGPNWTPRPTDEFLAAVSELTKAEKWVVDGNYSKVRDVLWSRATHIVWLNYDRSVVFSRVVWRTLKRTLLREKLWAGNQETFRKSFFSKESIVLWSVSTFAKIRSKYEELRKSNVYSHVRWVEFRQPREAHEYLRECNSVAV